MKWLIFIMAAATGLGSGAHSDVSLREAAQESGILIGTAVRPWALSEVAYASTLAHEFNMVEPEDSLKWEVVHPERDSLIFLKPIKLWTLQTGIA